MSRFGPAIAMLPILAFQTYEIVLIVIAIFVLFGGVTQIPKIAKALGRAKGEFQSARSEFDATANEAQAQAAAARAAAAARGDGENADEASTPVGTPTATPPAQPVSPPTLEQLQAAAADMGIDATGKNAEQLKRELNDHLG